MPAIKAGSKVLVTGASGFIAVHTVEQFLQAGHPVVGTVRSKDKGEYLANLFKSSKVPFEYVIVEDIGAEGAFDEAVKGVDGVAHTASPFHFNADDPKELFEPAVNGTVGVLKSIQKNNPNVQRVVITSSVAAVMDSRVKAPHTFTEKDWNEHSTQVCEEQGRDAPGGDKYRASKTLAEKAFWKFIADEKPSFDGATVNPPLVFGPIIHQVNSLDALNTSVAFFGQWQKGEHKADELPAPAGNYVDVREVALAHVKALTVDAASGERFITSAGPVSANDYVVALRKAFPDRKNIPEGDESAREKINASINVFQGSKATKTLGVNYRPIDETLIDMAKSLNERFGI